MYFSTSWDDNCVENEKLGNLLRKYAINGTFYIDDPQKNVTLVKELAQEFQIGAHSLHHSHLSRMSPSEQRKEILDSQEILEDIIQRQIDLFAYPYGDYNETTIAIVKESRFKFARTTLANRFYMDQFSPYEMPVSLLFCPTKFERNKNISSLIRVIRNRRNLITHHGIAARAIPFCYKTLIHIIANMSEKIDFLHIWGHGWQIRKHDYWDKLEIIFSLVKSSSHIIPVSNRELFVLSQQETNN